MYTFSSKLRLFSIIFMVVGLLGIVIGFITTPSTKEEVIEMLASEHHDMEHETQFEQTGGEDVGGEVRRNPEIDGNLSQENAGKNVDAHIDSIELDEEHAAVGHDDEHIEHVLHQLQNKPWAAIYVAAFFFFMIALGALVFYALQYVSQSGWSPVLFRVMEGITAYVLPGGIIMFILLALSAFHFNHLFVWMDEAVVAEDELIQGKTSFLNTPFFLIRAAIFIAGWSLYRHFAKKIYAKPR